MCDSTLWAHITWDRVGWGGDDDVRLHLHTCVYLHFGYTSHGIGWGGVGIMTFFGTCTHVRFYCTPVSTLLRRSLHLEPQPLSQKSQVHVSVSGFKICTRPHSLNNH